MNNSNGCQYKQITYNSNIVSNIVCFGEADEALLLHRKTSNDPIR